MRTKHFITPVAIAFLILLSSCTTTQVLEYNFAAPEVETVQHTMALKSGSNDIFKVYSINEDSVAIIPAFMIKGLNMNRMDARDIERAIILDHNQLASVISCLEGMLDSYGSVGRWDGFFYEICVTPGSDKVETSTVDATKIFKSNAVREDKRLIIQCYNQPNFFLQNKAVFVLSYEGKIAKVKYSDLVEFNDVLLSCL